MKSIYNYLKGSFGLIAVLLLAMGCSEKYEYSTDYSFYDDVALKVNLVDENNVLAVRLANKTHALTVATNPEDVFIASTAYLYEVADNSIATVSTDGTLTLLKVGETKLTVRFRGNQNISTNCTLKIEPTLISELVVAGNGVKVEVEKTLDLARYIAIIPSDADNQSLSYTVKEGSEEYAEIVEGSVVKGLKEGDATIVVSATDGSEISTELTLQVTGKIPVDEIVLGRAANLNGKTVAVGQVFDLGSVITTSPENASDPTVKYTLLSGKDVVELDAEMGIVTAVGAGEASIEVSAADGLGGTEPGVITFKVGTGLAWYERAFWLVDSTVKYTKGDSNYVPDNAGGGQPEKMIDGSNSTFFALVKPSKGDYGGYKHPDGAEFGFIVDLGGVQEFNRFKWKHRTDGTSTKFQAHKIRVSGSNDKKDYKVLEESLESKAASGEIELPLKETYTYRYIKVEYIEYDKSSGSLLCVAEFNVGKN